MIKKSVFECKSMISVMGANGNESCECTNAGKWSQR